MNFESLNARDWFSQTKRAEAIITFADASSHRGSNGGELAFRVGDKVCSNPSVVSCHESFVLIYLPQEYRDQSQTSLLTLNTAILKKRRGSYKLWLASGNAVADKHSNM